MSWDNPNNIDYDTGKPESYDASPLVVPSSVYGMTLSKDNWEQWLEQMSGIGNAQARDLWLNWMMSEKSASSARSWEELMDSTRYQRMVADAKKAGFNPYWALSNLAAGNLTGQNQSYGGSHYTTAEAQKISQQKADETQRHNQATEIFKALGMVLSAVLMAAAFA